MSKPAIIDQVIAREGGYSSSAADSGGATRWGIIEKTARRHDYKGRMQDLPRSLAVKIYAAEFWPTSYDQILELSPEIAAELFDTGVNLGVSKAGRYLQRSLNVLNQIGRAHV